MVGLTCSIEVGVREAVVDLVTDDYGICVRALALATVTSAVSRAAFYKSAERKTALSAHTALSIVFSGADFIIIFCFQCCFRATDRFIVITLCPSAICSPSRDQAK